MTTAVKDKLSGMDNMSKAQAAKKTYDRATQDVGNIVGLEHVHAAIGDQLIATAFYVLGLGLTRDPYLRVGLENMEINIGRGQLHLPTARMERNSSSMSSPSPVQRVRGRIGLVLPDLAELAQRLEKVVPLLKDTKFTYKAHADSIEVTCPWGNRFLCHPPSPEFGDTDLALAYVEFDVPRGAADGISRFYREGMLAIVKLEHRDGDAVACVDVGISQKLLFHETDDPIPPYDGHHIQIYVANHSVPHRFLNDRGLVTEESNAAQYRFRDIVDPSTGKILFTVEHEVRSMRHPSYNRPLVNRNPAQTNNNKERGHDAFRGSY